MSKQIKFTGFDKLIDSPHELCQWVKQDIEKCYKDSCVEVVKQAILKKTERAALNEDLDNLLEGIFEAHKSNDRELVAMFIGKIEENIRK